jgi:hypothetical protein
VNMSAALMYTTCIYCYKPLGSNEVIETFPIGGRLAFDSAKGRLWVVCRSCERWNLTPLESRWEAVEECERLFRDTRLRTSTENIGLARIADRVDLVRIGTPLRPEFAAWRYGDQFGRRRKVAFVMGGGIVLATGAVVAGAAAAGISIGAFGGLWGNIPNIVRSMRVVKLKTDAGALLKIRGGDIAQTRLAAMSDGSFELRITEKKNIHVFASDEALRHARRLVPAINASGGSKKTVQEAVRELQTARDPGDLVRNVARVGYDKRKSYTKPLAELPAATRLALEMALHEDSERRAIEGELEHLEQAWREAEEIAAIADNMFVSTEVEQKLLDLKKKKD